MPPKNNAKKLNSNPIQPYNDSPLRIRAGYFYLHFLLAVTDTHSPW